MTAKNRAGLIAKLQTSLKKHYKPAPAAPGRPLLHHILYAALLEDAPVDLADEGFAKCEQEFFDWNEVRVTSVTELAEVLANFPSPPTTATRLKRCLQSVFEGFYNFDIDHLKKENLGKAVAKFETMSGFSPFVLSYLVQHGLGGHAIPVSSAAMHIMLKTGIVNDAEARSGKVPGLERAIPKSKAIEFSSMLHQAAVALQADPLDKTVWEVIRSVNADAEASVPRAQRRPKGTKPAAAKADAGDQAVTEKRSSKTASKAEPKSKTKAGESTKSAAVKKEAAPAPSAKPAGKSNKSSKATADKADAAAAKDADAPAAAEGSAATKKGVAKSTKKTSASSKTSAAAKPAAGKGSAKAPEASAGAAASGAEDGAAGSGNHELTKQKPR